jgi:hypothetical protein
MTRRRYARLFAPVLLAVGLLAGSVGTANAQTWTWAGVPFSGACKFGYWASLGDISPTIEIAAYGPNAPYAGGTCASYWRFGIYCGVYGLPGTYYWQWSQPIYSTYPPYQGSYGGSVCPTWGNDIILNIVIVVSGGPNFNICWNHNAGNWVWIRQDVPCHF